MKLKDQTFEHDRLMTWDDTFSFKCHRDIDCFNSCCRDVTIFLNPLDVLRLRKALGISSTKFLEQYTHRVVSRVGGMPAVVLKMTQDDAKKCPFVGDNGCRVYENRPYSCRLYPLDTEQGVEFRFIAGQDMCHGLRVSEEWTVERWRHEQGLHAYDDLDHNLKDVMSADQLWESKIEDARMQDMILMALYDPDRFREFVFDSSFLQKFRVDDDIIEKIRSDDVSLLYFAAQWLRFALFGKKGFLKIDRDYLERKKVEVLGKKGL
ncbi:MAG: YkgJ family cysteine cluster protein [Desulfomonile sp.]|jgi:Fe-S-cluster containining protein|nr:YkgJ family cysteine cluster protein [Deltaproteobacteria bacterium]